MRLHDMTSYKLEEKMVRMCHELIGPGDGTVRLKYEESRGGETGSCSKNDLVIHVNVFFGK